MPKTKSRSCADIAFLLTLIYYQYESTDRNLFMNSVIQTLKSKKIWIPLSIFFVLVLPIASFAYFLSRGLNAVSEEAPPFPINDIIIASLDPEKSKHLQKAEFAFFDAEKYAALKDYKRAHLNFSEAADQFAAAMGSASPVVCVMLIRQAEFEGKYRKWDEAEATLRRAAANLSKGEKNAELTFAVNRWLGYTLQRHQKYGEAISVLLANVALGKSLDTAKHLAAQPNRRVALRSLSACYVAAKQYDNATKASNELLAVVQKLPNSRDLVTNAWIELGRIQINARLYPKAIEAYSKALAVDSGCIEAFRARGIAYGEMNNERAAISDFTILLKLDHKDENAYEWRAYAYEADGQKEKAIEDLTTAIKLSGTDSSSVYDSRARLLATAGRYKEAINDYGQSLAIDDDPWTYTYRAKAYEELGQHAEAIADYSKALESDYFVKHPNNRGARNGVAQNQKTMGAVIYLKRSKCYAALGKKDLAEADQKESAALDAAKPEPKKQFETGGQPEPDLSE
jgi:tetratricopeptide (TPR) repeat protein